MFVHLGKGIIEKCSAIYRRRKVRAPAKMENQEDVLFRIRFSLIDAWVSGYLLVLVHHAAEKSQLRTIFMQNARLVDYIQRIDDEQTSQLAKERDEHSLLPAISSENSVDIVSILHVVSQVVSFSIFFFMLTKIGANSYSITN